jgi:hypothetical protein
MCVAANAHLQFFFPKHKIVCCGIPISVSLRALYCPCNDCHESLVVQVRVHLIKSAAGPTWTRWWIRVELMNRIPLRTIEAVIFLKLSRISAWLCLVASSSCCWYSSSSLSREVMYGQKVGGGSFVIL